MSPAVQVPGQQGGGHRSQGEVEPSLQTRTRKGEREVGMSSEKGSSKPWDFVVRKREEERRKDPSCPSPGRHLASPGFALPGGTGEGPWGEGLEASAREEALEGNGRGGGCLCCWLSFLHGRAPLCAPPGCREKPKILLILLPQGRMKEPFQ